MFNNKNKKIKKGNRIQCICNIENVRHDEFETKDKFGTIKCLENGEYGVEFDEFIIGHSLTDKKGRNHCDDGYGLWLKSCHFKVIHDNKKSKQINNNTYNKGEDEKMEKNIVNVMENMVDMMGLMVKEFKKNDNEFNKERVTINFARKNNDVIIPSKEDENAGFDIYAYFDQEEFEFKPHETKLVPTGLYSAVSQGYALIGKERGSTGSIGMKLGAGVIDSGYRNEIFIAITNDNDIPLIISKNVSKTIKNPHIIIYPYSKAIAQLKLEPVPLSEVKEISLDELKAIPSKRGDGCLGSSGK